MDLKSLIYKYNVPAPRYTSYPTVPFWDRSGITREDWKESVLKIFRETNSSKGISLYIHLPFCESLCTYCACNTRITRNHSVEGPYLEALKNEWNYYLSFLPQKPVIRELHLGGGTPTFFSPEHLKKLIRDLLDTVDLHPDHDFGFEGHPNNTTREHLQALFDVGFRRVSFGVQDLDDKVMKTINRVQPFENVREATCLAREIGYDSVNFDLIYGLPYQTIATIEHTFHRVLDLKPQRIAFYSYAHVPWIKPGQRSYTEADLPDNDYKRALYETGCRILRENGYRDLGMDHFALPEDELFQAYYRGEMHRNFMGYTTSHSDLLLGLGASSISDAGYAYAQNAKSVEEYTDAIIAGTLPLIKGHKMSDRDRMIKSCILDLTCRGNLSSIQLENFELSRSQWDELDEMKGEGLIHFNDQGLIITQKGKPFLRNICMVFDEKLREKNHSGEELFSKSI
jgi:oxygen-independent coproporphyrinogen-3 oxidase